MLCNASVARFEAANRRKPKSFLPPSLRNCVVVVVCCFFVFFVCFFYTVAFQPSVGWQTLRNGSLFTCFPVAPPTIPREGDACAGGTGPRGHVRSRHRRCCERAGETASVRAR